MSNFVDAYNFMMDNEDSQRKHATVPDAPQGSFAISGINSFSFPNEFQIINGIPQKDRDSWVEQFYNLHFWNKWLEQITSDELVKRVFDASVNMGAVTAVKLLQEAINNTVPNSVVKDGHFGPNTIAHTNAIGDLVPAFKAARSQHYKDIVTHDPAKEKYLKAWLTRAQK